MSDAVAYNVRLDDRNTLGIPARARAWASIDHRDQLSVVLARAREAGWPVAVLGAGSNVVLSRDWPGLILQPAFRGIEVLDENRETVTVRIGAAEDWHTLVEHSLHRGWYGLENLALIPGSVGAAPVQNIGAYGRELSEFLVSVDAARLDNGEWVTLTVDDCALGYRTSRFRQAPPHAWLIAAVTLRLSRRPDVCVTYPSLREQLAQAGVDEPDPQQVFDAVVAIRRARLPDLAETPNAGSFFKNPVLPRTRVEALRETWPSLPWWPVADPSRAKVSAAWLVEQAGYRGRLTHGVGMSAAHALVLTNPGHADGAAVLTHARAVQEAVHEQFSISLEIEPIIF